MKKCDPTLRISRKSCVFFQHIRVIIPLPLFSFMSPDTVVPQNNTFYVEM